MLGFFNACFALIHTDSSIIVLIVLTLGGLGENVGNKKEEKIESYPYPWNSLNSMTYGMRRGELVLVTAGSGIGKSSVMRELAHYLMKTANEKVGCLFLEESVRKTSDGILSIEPWF